MFRMFSACLQIQNIPVLSERFPKNNPRAVGLWRVGAVKQHFRELRHRDLLVSAMAIGSLFETHKLQSPGIKFGLSNLNMEILSPKSSFVETRLENQLASSFSPLLYTWHTSQFYTACPRVTASSTSTLSTESGYGYVQKIMCVEVTSPLCVARRKAAVHFSTVTALTSCTSGVHLSSICHLYRKAFKYFYCCLLLWF